jgi:hypothetical protein
MKRLYMAILVVAATVLAGIASGQQAASVAGKWKMESTTSGGDAVDWTLTLKQEGDNWTATVGGEDGEAPGKEVRVDGTSVHVKTPYHGDYYDVDVKLEGDKLTGKWSGNGDSGPTNGTRVTTPA